MNLPKLPDMSKDKAVKIGAMIVVIVIVVMIVVFGKEIIGFIQKLFGSDPQAAAAKQTVQDSNMASSNPNSPFSPDLYNNDPDDSTLDYPTLQSMCQGIKDAVSILPNFVSPPDGAEMFAQFKMCNNKIDVSNFAVVFQQLYNQD